MKVLLQHPTKPQEISGVATFIRNTAELLSRSGVEVRTLTTATASDREIKEGVAWADIVHLSSNAMRTYWLARRAKKPVIVHYHYPFWGTWKKTEADRELDFGACWKRSIRIYWEQGNGWRFSIGYAKYFIEHVLRSILRVYLCREADARITCSEFMRENSKIPWPISVIPYGFDFDSVKSWHEKPFPTSASFCFIGRMTIDKGVPAFLKAAAILKKKNVDVHFHLIGGGRRLEEFELKANELGLDGSVTFHGRLEWEPTLEVLANCTALVIPSNYDEAAGYVVTEAYALKRAVIGSDRGGIPEQVGPGLIFPADDHFQLADQMRRLAGDLSYARQLGEQGYEYARQRSDNAQAFIDIFTGLLSPKPV